MPVPHTSPTMGNQAVLVALCTLFSTAAPAAISQSLRKPVDIIQTQAATHKGTMTF